MRTCYRNKASHLLALGFWGLWLAAAPAQAFFYSLNVGPTMTQTQLNACLDHYDQLGVNGVYCGAMWWWLSEAGERNYNNIAGLDRVVNSVKARNKTLVLQVAGTPAWVHPDLAGEPEHYWYPPMRTSQELAQWGQFIKDLVGRYGTQVDVYEIWNEPNLDSFWKPSPNPADFYQLVRTAYLAAKQVNPNAKIAMGAFCRSDLGFLETYYQNARGNTTEAMANKWYFDVLSLHPYCDHYAPDYAGNRDYQSPYGTIDPNFLGYRRMRQKVRDQEGEDKPLLFGEFGYSTVDTWHLAVPDATRAQYLKTAFQLIRADGYIIGMNWYIHEGDGGFDIHNTLTEQALREIATFPQPPKNLRPKF